MTAISRVSNILALALFSTGFFASTGRAAAPAPSQRQAHFEVQFMEGMIDHHAMGISMAQMCLQKAIHPELRATCQNIIASQSAEIQIMQSWLLGWYGISYSPDPSNKGMKKLEKLTGQEFEIEFMEMMSEHHAEAIRESTDCLLIAYHKELRDLCENIIKAQSTEINLFRTWLCQWYGECDPV
jgi:uncharacterized protein (DUF305 family)